MAFTKITHAGIGSTGTVLLQNLDVIGIATAGFGVSTVDVFTTGITTFANETDSTSSTTGSVIVSGGVGIAGSLNVGGSVSVGGTLTYEDVTNVDSIGIITARSEIRVGSGITLSKDGDAFHTGVVTATTFVGNLTGNPTGSGASLTALNATQLTSGTIPDARFPATLPAISGANLTGVAAGKFISDAIGVTTNTPIGIETGTIARKDLTGPAGNTATGAGSSFHGAYMGDGFLSFNTEFSNPTGYYISTFTNALVAGPMQLGTTLSIDGTFTIV